MKLNPLLVAAGLVYLAAGLPLVFAPSEILTAMGAPPSAPGAWMAQLLGAALMGLAFLDGMQRYSAVEGILGRSILVANLAFTTIAFFASLSAFRHRGGPAFLTATIVLGILAFAFGFRLFGGPRRGIPRPEEAPRGGGVTRRSARLGPARRRGR